MYTNLKYRILYFLLLCTIISCREPFDIDGIDVFESVLVVEGTVTNEFKNQEIILSRTSSLNGTEPIIENNAEVIIVDSDSNRYSFSMEESTGKYISDVAFKAQDNLLYQLFITTADGKRYKSKKSELTPRSQIDNLYTELNSKENSISVLVDSNNENQEVQFFRYEYEETYKIVAPEAISFRSYFIDETKIDIINGNVGLGPLFEYVIFNELTKENKKVCFTTAKSFGLKQTSTNELTENNVFRFPIRTIDVESSIIRERYSILVKQYVQNVEAFTFYKQLNDLGNIGSILSESQPGFISGNITSDNINDKVLGFFEVSSVSERRIYFNYNDFDIAKPPYFTDCNLIYDEELNKNLNPNHVRLDYGVLGPDLDERVALYELINDRGFIYRSNQFGVYYVVSPRCGDCTSFSSNIKPDFWED